MNAPPSINSEALRDVGSSCVDGAIEGVARHVSAEGCQLVLTGKAPAVGRRLGIAHLASGPIAGTITWVLGSRVGFAFDRAIDAATAAQLTAHLAQIRALQSLPAAMQEPLG